MSVDKKEIRKELKRVAELASGERLQASMQEFRQVTGDEPTDWDLEFWHAGYKHGALALIDAVREAQEKAWDEGGMAMAGSLAERIGALSYVAPHNPYRKEVTA